jgi:hypothetical protein
MCPLRTVPIQNWLITTAHWRPLMYADCRDVARYVWVCGGRLASYISTRKSSNQMKYHPPFGFTDCPVR